MESSRKRLLCLITCYYDTNYIRTATLTDALKRTDINYVHVKNTSRGLRRYIEVILGLTKMRLTKNPDVYYLTFRGYEILPIVRLITIGKPLVFDEFINPLELVVHEQKLVKNKIIQKILWLGYRFWLNIIQAITTDTESHAKYSAELMNLPLTKYTVVPLGTDEVTFDAKRYGDVKPRDDKFQVFYYGSMLPLHGVDVVLEAMTLLKDYKNIELLIVGGKEKTLRKIYEAQQSGANVQHKRWIDYDQLPKAMKRANICLGGPFGNTIQAQYVITGKTYQQLSLGCPVIVGKNHESDIFTDKVNALVVEQGSAGSLAETILWAYNNRDHLPTIGRGGKSLYDEKFSMNHLSKKLGALITSLIEHR